MAEFTGKLMVRISPETHKALRYHALDEGRSMRELVEDVIETAILRKARPAPAKTAG